MKNYPVHFDFEKIKLIPVDLKLVGNYKNEGQFMSLSVELLKEVASFTVLLACTYPIDKDKRPRNWLRNESVISGLLVRISKLQSGYLDQVCQRRGETAGILFRCLMETLINIKYLITKNDPLLFDEYIEYSLREEKKLLLKIHKNILERDNKELPIEKRMLISIHKTFEKSGFTPEEVDEKNRNSWGGSIYKRAKAVQMEDAYLSIIGLPSHAIHGNWQDLISNHLDYEEDASFTPNSNWSSPRPQAPLAVALFSTQVILLYLNKVIPDYQEKQYIKDRLNELFVRVSVADELHEKFLQI